MTREWDPPLSLFQGQNDKRVRNDMGNGVLQSLFVAPSE